MKAVLGILALYEHTRREHKMYAFGRECYEKGVAVQKKKSEKYFSSHKLVPIITYTRIDPSIWYPDKMPEKYKGGLMQLASYDSLDGYYIIKEGQTPEEAIEYLKKNEHNSKGDYKLVQKWINNPSML